MLDACRALIRKEAAEGGGGIPTHARGEVLFFFRGMWMAILDAKSGDPVIFYHQFRGKIREIG